MHTVITALLLLLSLNIFSQAGTSVEGKWKIIRMSDEEMSVNLKYDSVTFSEEFKAQFKPEKDSLAAIQIMQAVMKEC